MHDSEGNRIPAYTINASASGMGLKIDRAGHPHVQLNLNDVVTLEFPQRGVRLQARVLSVFAVSSLSMGMGLSYQLASSEDERAAIDIAFGSSEQLIRNNRNRHQGRSIPKAFLYLLKFGFVHGVAHLSALVRELISKQKQQTKN
ncbi:MAG: PilZ domain-containing protein [Methylobacillus glycogenes]|nr:PilZ domain-containing protein [Methylobacillus glycogenes]